MRLKELRNKKGVTQEQVAKAIGIPANNYARYERNERNPDYDTLKLLATYFETSVDYIIGYSEV